MKKNFTVNISGTIFHIDDDAFHKLDAYLNNIKKHFRGTDGADEIYNDIEARIAEMLHERTSEDQVITIDKIEEVIGIMGQPFEFESEAEGVEERMTGQFKRLYRSMDDKYLGGVCGGLGAYFNLDPIWFRILFVVFTMIGGAGVLVYLILWVVLPVARSTAEKLEMRGQSVNISNIENSIREEFNGIKDKFSNLTKSATSGDKKKSGYEPGLDRLGNVIYEIARTILRLSAIVAGILIFIIGLSFLGVLIASLTDNSFLQLIPGLHYISFPDLFNTIMGTESQVSTAVAGIFLISAPPFLFLLYAGLRLIFGEMMKIQYTGIVLFSLWIAGIVICSVMAYQVLTDFRETSVVEDQYTFNPGHSQVIYVSSFNPEDYLEDRDLQERNMIYFPHADNSPELKIVVSSDSLFHLKVKRYARGVDHNTARKRSSLINFTPVMKDSTIQLPGNFQYPDSVPFRYQHASMVLEVPANKVLVLNRNTSGLFGYNNYTKEYHTDISGKRWLMNENGVLEAINPTQQNEEYIEVEADSTYAD